MPFQLYNAQQISHLIESAIEYKDEFPEEIRMGQAIINVIDASQEIPNLPEGTDCFYDDDNIPAFLKFISLPEAHEFIDANLWRLY